jgi:hypothetical protein
MQFVLSIVLWVIVSLGERGHGVHFNRTVLKQLDLEVERIFYLTKTKSD